MNTQSSFQQAAWSLLLAHGGALPSLISLDDHDGFLGDALAPFSTVLAVDPDVTREALAAVRDVGIDWVATSEPSPGTGAGFNDTDNSIELAMLVGKLTVLDGRSWWFVTATESRWVNHVDGSSLAPWAPMQLPEILRRLTDAPADHQLLAADRLDTLDRFSGKHAVLEFAKSCSL
jgi:hypothetical protein